MGATYLRQQNDIRKTAVAAIAAGDVHQLADGRAGVFTGQNAASSGQATNWTTAGQFTFPKAAGCLLDGGRAYWDRSAGNVSYKKVNDRDYYLGRVVGDAATGDTTCVVNINVNPPADIDLVRDAFLSVATGTQAVGGFGLPVTFGGAKAIQLTATSEVQCVDLLSVDKFDPTANPIAEFVFRVAANGSGAAVDFNVGLANGTSASDADAVTEHCYVHVDGGDLSLWVQSKDGTTTVAAADSTLDLVAGTAVANRVEVWIDARNPADIQVYVNGALVLGATVFRLDNAVGPLGLLIHLEKSTGTATAGPIYIDRAAVRYAEQ